MSYSVEDCEPVEFYREKIRRARKPHKCDACGATIRPGDLHSYTSAKFEGQVETIRRCGRCQATFDHLTKIGKGEMQPDWRLACGLDYEVEWGPVPDEIARLPFLTDAEASALLEPKP